MDFARTEGGDGAGLDSETVWLELKRVGLAHEIWMAKHRLADVLALVGEAGDELLVYGATMGRGGDGERLGGVGEALHLTGREAADVCVAVDGGITDCATATATARWPFGLLLAFPVAFSSPVLGLFHNSMPSLAITILIHVLLRVVFYSRIGDGRRVGLGSVGAGAAVAILGGVVLIRGDGR